MEQSSDGTNEYLSKTAVLTLLAYIKKTLTGRPPRKRSSGTATDAIICNTDHKHAQSQSDCEAQEIYAKCQREDMGEDLMENVTRDPLSIGPDANGAQDLEERGKDRPATVHVDHPADFITCSLQDDSIEVKEDMIGATLPHGDWTIKVQARKIQAFGKLREEVRKL